MIYILLPAYNEKESIDVLFPKIARIFDGQIDEEYKILACNDGSSDNTGELLRNFSTDLPIKIIEHRLNRGLGESIRDLFEEIYFNANEDDIIIRMDCDDTHDPKYIPSMIEKIEKGYDVVIASRFVKGGEQTGLPFYRKVISHFANYFMRLFFPIKGLKEYSSGYRAYRAEVIKHAIDIYGNNFIQLKNIGFACTLEKLIKLKIIGAKFTEVPFQLKYDQKRSSSKMVSSITSFGYLMLVIFYYWPWGGWRRNYKDVQKLNSE